MQYAFFNGIWFVQFLSVVTKMLTVKQSPAPNSATHALSHFYYSLLQDNTVSQTMMERMYTQDVDMCFSFMFLLL